MKVFALISNLFSYPNGGYKDILAKLSLELKPYGEIVETDFLPVVDHFSTLSIPELQEYYIRTFDVNAACYLDIGYVLFGEESKRGQFLLNMKNEQIKAINDCGTEFPDHLPNVLTLLPKLKDHLFKEELIVIMLLPALKHMLDNFRTETNTYKHLLKCLISLLETTFPDSGLVPYEINQKEIECAGAYSCGMDFTKLSNKKY